MCEHCGRQPGQDLEILSKLRNLQETLKDATKSLAEAQFKLEGLLTLNDPNIATITIHGGLKLLPSEFNIIHELLLDHQKIPAIKALRRLRNLGLKDAKDIIDHTESHGNYPGNRLCTRDQ